MPTTYLEAIRQGIQEEMDRDPNVFLVGEDIGVLGGAFRLTAGLFERFGERRVIDMPLSEAGLVGAAIGAALIGLRPVAEIQYIDFITCAFDQVVNFAAKCRFRWGAAVPLVIRGPAGGGVHAGPFHSQNPEAWFLHIPGLKVVAPATAYDAKGLIKSAIRDNDPVLFFEHKGLYRRIKEEVPAEDYTIPLGKAAVFRSGSDLSIITYAAMVYVAEQAAETLAQAGISAEIIDLRTLLPLDEDAILESVRKTSRVIVLHEDTLTGGVGAEIAARIAEKAFGDLDAPVVRIAAPDCPVPYSPVLESVFIPSAAQVVEKARWLCSY